MNEKYRRIVRMTERELESVSAKDKETNYNNFLKRPSERAKAINRMSVIE